MGKRKFKDKSGWVCVCGKDKVFGIGKKVDFGRTQFPCIDFKRVVFSTRTDLIKHGSGHGDKCFYCHNRVNPVRIKLHVEEVIGKSRVKGSGVLGASRAEVEFSGNGENLIDDQRSLAGK